MILYQPIQTLIKHAFLFNYPYELLMNLITMYNILVSQQLFLL